MYFKRQLVSLSKKISIATYIQQSKKNVIFPFYHLVSNADCWHIKHLYPYKNVATFERDLDYILKNYNPISISDLAKIKSITKPSFLLTFDDGLREMFEEVAPLLLRKGVPAVFFINPPFIDNKALMYRYKISVLWEKYLQKKSATIDKKIETISEIPLKDFLWNQKKDTAEIARIASILEVDFNDYLKENSPYLSNNQMKWMHQKGFAFGAHSMQHIRYNLLSAEEQQQETFQSIEWLQHNFPCDYNLFAFPFEDIDVSKKYFDWQFGKGKVDFSFGTSGLKEEQFTNHFHRIAMENEFSAEENISFAYLKRILQQPFNKHLINRLA